MPERDLNRLPTTVVPTHYDLELAPDLDAATFTGTAEITIVVTEAVEELVLHALDLEIAEAWLEGGDGRRIDATPSFDAPSETVTLALSAPAEAGPWALHARFSGELNDKLVGFYRSTFTDDEGTTRTLACTQFESTHARRAFPCWDEPAFKATFAIRLVVADGLFAVSNAAETAVDELPDGRRRVHFAPTMHMSTYLVAFVVGPLEATDPVDVDGVPLRVIAVPGKADLTPFALEIGAFSLRYLSDWYGIAYPGDKLDLIAIPDFAFGAMENLGCVTFRETALLLDEERSTQAELQRVADVVAQLQRQCGGPSCALCQHRQQRAIDHGVGVGPVLHVGRGVRVVGQPGRHPHPPDPDRDNRVAVQGKLRDLHHPGDHADVAAHVVVAVRAGERLAVERDDRLGSGPVYVALSGWSPDRVLGSCATDTFGRIGGAVAGPGYVLRGAAARGANRVGAYWRPVPTATGPVRVVPTQGILGGSWQVDAVSRSGIRLQAREDLRAGGSTALAPSRPVVPGTVQRLPTGGLIVLGPDGGVTGGYPVAAVVATVDLDRLWLLAPGSAVRFAPVTVEAAAHAFVQQQVRVRRGFGHPDLSG